MATVRFSEDLKAAIKRRAEDMFVDQINTARKNYPTTWGETIYDLMFKDTKAIMYSLPEGFMNVVSGIFFPGFGGDGWVKEINQSVQLSLPEPRRMPKSNDAGGLGLLSSPGYGNRMFDAGDPRWDDLKLEYAAYCHEIMRLEARRDIFVAGVEKVTATYSTLAPALKAWPPLWDLIPPDKQAKHKEIVARKKSGEVVVEGVDLNSLSGVVIAAKITK